MNVLNTLTNDLNWRETEIASMRVLLSIESSSSQRIVLLRAAWALLYAHYEGFCKNALITFFDAVSNAGVCCSKLPRPTRLFALGQTFRHLRSLSDNDFLSKVESFPAACLEAGPAFPNVDTQSNLWPDVLIGLMSSADLSPAKVEEHRVKLSTLVARRNSIAHGEINIIPEVSYYRSYEDAVYDVIYDLAYQVDSRLAEAPYKLK